MKAGNLRAPAAGSPFEHTAARDSVHSCRLYDLCVELFNNKELKGASWAAKQHAAATAAVCGHPSPSVRLPLAVTWCNPWQLRAAILGSPQTTRGLTSCVVVKQSLMRTPHNLRTFAP